MATKKPASSTTKKKTASKAATRTTSKAPAKKPTRKPVRATATRSAKKKGYQSFQLAESQEPFMQVAITRQTIYWLILGAVVVVFGWYLMSMYQSIQDIYIQIDEIRAAEMDAPVVVSQPTEAVE